MTAASDPAPSEPATSGRESSNPASSSPASSSPAPVALVTGAGSGLGRYIAIALGEAGYRVALAGRRAQALEETAGQTPAETFTAPTDVGDPAAVAALFDGLAAEWGRIDLLVNNAGTFAPAGAVDEVAHEDWQHAVDVNLTGPFLCAHHAVRMMKTQQPPGGRIINNGSISAHTPRPRSIAYTATKHAITGLTKSIALDGREHGIACGQIDIGNAATDMTSGIAAGAAQADGTTRPEATFDPQHAARAVVHMASLPPEANMPFVTLTATRMPYLGRG